MNKFILLALVVLFALVSAHGNHDSSKDEEIFNPPNSQVVNADAATIEEVLGKSQYVLMEFYAPWCPHCKQLATTYEKVAAQLKEKGIVVAKIDCDKNKEVAQKYNIAGFPSVKLFKDGKLLKDFEEADRSVEGIVRWVEKKTGPAAVSIKAAEVEDFVKGKSTSLTAIVVGTFASKESAEYKSFIGAAESLDDFVFAEVVEEKATPSVKLYKAQLGEEDVVLSAEDLASSEAATKAIKSQGYSLVDEVNAKSFQRYAADKLPLGVVFLDNSKAEEKKEVLSALREAAKALKGKFNFGFSDGLIYGEQYAIMGGNKEKLPGLAVMNLENRRNYPYTGELKGKQIIEFAENILAGKVEPFLRSEPIPEKNDEPVKVVVGKSFQQIVMDDTKDVLLEFYAPWCGHCQKLAPKYEELAQFFSSVKELVIAKIDATQNDSPVQVEGFPTIYYFPADAKDEPVQYEGNRSIADLKKFIKKNASEKVKDQVKALLKKDDKKEEKKEEKKKEDKKQKDEL